MGVIGGALAIELFSRGRPSFVLSYAGGEMIIMAVIVSVYEVIMIVFALIEKVNHQVRLVVVSIYEFNK